VVFFVFKHLSNIHKWSRMGLHGINNKEDTVRRGIVVFSFALSSEEPNRCNRRLARAAERIIAQELMLTGKRPIVIAQWEVAAAMLFPPDLIVREHHIPGKYLDSNEVMAQAAEFLRKLHVTEVIPVAQPFLQLGKCVSLTRKEGFRPLRRDIGWIGFYRKSIQWWTRNPILLVVGAVLQVLFGYPQKKLPWLR
jgi:hypothetical protein